MVAMVLAAGAIYFVEHDVPDTQFTSIPRSMWWAIVTITTVGYGDMVPVTAVGRIIGGVVAMIGICALALPVGIISTGYIDDLEKEKQPAREKPAACPHCGQLLDGTDKSA